MEVITLVPWQDDAERRRRKTTRKDDAERQHERVCLWKMAPRILQATQSKLPAADGFRASGDAEDEDLRDSDNAGDGTPREPCSYSYVKHRRRAGSVFGKRYPVEM